MVLNKFLQGFQYRKWHVRGQNQLVFAHFMHSWDVSFTGEKVRRSVNFMLLKLLIVDIGIFWWGMLSLTWDAWRDAAASAALQS